MSETYQPIISMRPLQRVRLFDDKIKPRANVAIVLYGEGRAPVAYFPGDYIPVSEARFGRFTELYEVDLTVHRLRFNWSLPCRGDALAFVATVELDCLVDAPGVIIQRGVTDARQVLEPVLLTVMRDTSRGFPPEQAEAAEAALRAAAQQGAAAVGFRLDRVFVQLSLPPQTQSYVDETVTAGYAHDRNLVEARRQHELDVLRQQHQRQLELAQAQHQAELARHQVEIDRIQFEAERERLGLYAEIARAGQWELLGLHLAKNPGDASGVLRMLSQERQAARAHYLEALDVFLRNDALEAFQVSETAKQALQRLLEDLRDDGVGQRLGADDRLEVPAGQRPAQELPAAEASAPTPPAEP
jgi:hypothetical protein